MIDLSIIQEADMVLNVCGRAVPPAGARFVDLPKILPYHQDVTVALVTPREARLANNSNTTFIVEGIIFKTDPVPVRIKWPSGRYLTQNPSPSPTQSGACFPQAVGGNMLRLNQPVAIPRGEKIGIEVGAGVTGSVDVQFWGRLRYLMKAGAASRSGMTRETDSASCIVGYPAVGEMNTSCVVGYPSPEGGPGGVAGPASGLMDDPIAKWARTARYDCGPNQNILAPEFRVSNPVDPFAPAGKRSDSFTFFSPAIICPVGGSIIGTAVILPGLDGLVLRRVRAISTWPGGITGDPVYGIRLPNGYSVMGGDLISAQLTRWLPVFPTLPLAAGDRLVIDVSNINGAGVGSITTVFEFDAAKRYSG